MLHAYSLQECSDHTLSTHTNTHTYKASTNVLRSWYTMWNGNHVRSDQWPHFIRHEVNNCWNGWYGPEHNDPCTQYGNFNSLWHTSFLPAWHIVTLTHTFIHMLQYLLVSHKQIGVYVGHRLATMLQFMLFVLDEKEAHLVYQCTMWSIANLDSWFLVSGPLSMLSSITAELPSTATGHLRLLESVRLFCCRQFLSLYQTWFPDMESARNMKYRHSFEVSSFCWGKPSNMKLDIIIIVLVILDMLSPSTYRPNCMLHMYNTTPQRPQYLSSCHR